MLPIPLPQPSSRPRVGPRPLALHLANARLAWAGPAADPASQLELRSFFQGLQAYWRHPYRRGPESARVVWSCGSGRVLDYGPDGGMPLLVVPSLINRAYILDLLPDRSLLRHLSGAGFRVLLFDWGEPGPRERRLTLSDAIVARLGGALAWLRRQNAPRPLLLGYCMGGLLALALAARQADAVAGLALLATPWDFHADGLEPEAFDAVLARPGSALAGLLGGLPVDAIQALFASLDPLQVPRKFARFAALDPSSRAALTFVAVEDWLNDGVPLPPEIARECLDGWYGQNRPGTGTWEVAGAPVRPEALELPCLVAIPARDRIVPPKSAERLARALPCAEVLRPAGGHIAMVVGARAERDLWAPLAAWLGRIAALQK